MSSPTPKVDALTAKWDDDGATRGSAFIEMRDLARQLESMSEPGGVYLPPAAVKGFRVVLREFDSIVGQFGGTVVK